MNAKVFVLPTCAAAMFLLSACDDGTDQGSNTPTPEPTIVAIPGHEPGTTTGEPEVDAIIEALLSRDWSRILPLVEVQEVECVENAEQILALECPDDIVPGTPVRAVIFSAGEGFWVLEQELEDMAPGVVPAGSLLYAVLRPPPELESDFVIVFAMRGPTDSVPLCSPSISVNAGRIVHFSYGCPQDPERRIAQIESAGPVEFLLAPPP